LSPELSRGFSGEGQALEALADGRWRDVLPRVQASLRWHSAVDAEPLAASLNTSVDDVRAALAVLGTRGLVGYDLARQSYFHRELPFELDGVEKQQPRLKDARELVAAGKVRMVSRDADALEARVASTGVEQRVTHRGDAWKCTCRWYAKHQGSRGPCKHVLAVQLTVNPDAVPPTETDSD